MNVDQMYSVLRDALFIAAVANSPRTVRLLLRNDARINRLDKDGDNALETHLSYPNNVTQEICMLLFAAGEGVTKVTHHFSFSEIEIKSA